jgi:hydroxymethylpyrimidine/phosphomethylpyrimidine kinase
MNSECEARSAVQAGSDEALPAPELPVAMTIAGSDSGGGAGVQADLKTFHALNVFGTCAVTCITAQNPDTVARVDAVAPDMVIAQIETVCDGFPVKAAKTGMLYSAEAIRAVASVVGGRFPNGLVVDPVMVATSGARLLRRDAVEALQSDLIPLASVITPNLPEAEVLCGRPIRSVDELIAACQDVSRRFGVACIAKGGHLGQAAAAQEVVDVLCVKGRTTALKSAWVAARQTHGTGCTFSAALTAFLASGYSLDAAFSGAKKFVATALRRSFRTGRQTPLGIGR